MAAGTHWGWGWGWQGGGLLSAGASGNGKILAEERQSLRVIMADAVGEITVLPLVGSKFGGRKSFARGRPARDSS
ncbi:hypothetical protein CRG98_048503 [Punica granatum]|uniref:Uncharacterized protein n=1 Tax=Punica granatum TaxID=22663 RepID=A0A2I0HHD7_PUNGR|nr:hypothetical protein CRG98_048503 [Punica granatum]